MVYRLILADWAKAKYPNNPPALEGEFTDEQITSYNRFGYNIYFFPNYPSVYNGSSTVDGKCIDVFSFVFVDMDLKDKIYKSKEDFLVRLDKFSLKPTFIVDSGRGIHAYWEVSDLDVMAYLRLQRRLYREFNTDDSIWKIAQLMRVPNTYNTKNGENNYILCQTLASEGGIYSCEDLDKVLPSISLEDEKLIQYHYEGIHNPNAKTFVNEKIPFKFAELLKNNSEVKDLWLSDQEDRSAADYRLGHILYSSTFTKEEAIAVLVNTEKASARAPKHRLNYANNIVEKIWQFETTKMTEGLSQTVSEILSKTDSKELKGVRFPCWKYLDNTDHGFRLGQVIGLVAGSGVGKTAISLNMFLGFVQNNPDYVHFFVPLEQPVNEIALRWKNLCGENIHLYGDKVHLISNYNEDGTFRHLSFDDIQTYIVEFQQKTGKKAGCVVIDHIGALKKKGKKGENQDLMDICHAMKAFAIQTNTLLVMQSQAPRQKAGIGDLELDKDAAFGTVFFESYCDYLVTLWQPLKRCYAEGAPTVTSFKFCKIRHKNQKSDIIKEDVCYKMFFDSDTQKLREMTEIEEKSFSYFLNQAVNKRKRSKHEDLQEYVSIKEDGNVQGGTPNANVRVA